MRVALVSPYTWTTPGGVNGHIAGLARELRSRGHEVRIIAPADGDPGGEVFPVGGTVGIPFNGSVARLAFGPRVASRLRVAFRRARPEIVHVHEPFAPSAAMLATMLARVPVVATFHAAIDSTLYRVAGVPLRPLWRKLAVKITVSAAARGSIERIFDAGVRIIPNGVDLSRFAAVPPVDPAAKTVLFFGRMERRKGPQVLVDAIPAILRGRPGARVVFAGDGAMRAELERRVPAELRSAVSFTGRYDDDDLLALLASASVVCLPALGGESFGYTVVEAMAAGRPVAATHIPGYAAVARDDREAVLVPTEDPVALARAVGRLLDDADLARRLAGSGRERARRYDWPVVAEEIEAVYREVLEGVSRAR